MKKINILFLLVIILFLIPISAGSMPGNLYEKEAQESIAALAAAMPAAELFIIEVKDEEIFLDKGENILRAGMELSLVRVGGEYSHPLSGEFLGRFEEDLGEIIISEVKENYYIARPVRLKEGAIIKKGDKARVTSRKIKVALWDSEGIFKQPPDEDSMTRKFIYKLEMSERFELVSYDKFIAALDKISADKGKPRLSNEELKKLNEILGIKGIIIPKINGDLLETKFLSINGNILAKASIPLQSKEKPIHDLFNYERDINLK